MSPPGPATPWVWVMAGVPTGILGTLVRFAGADDFADDSIRPLVGAILLAIAGFLILVGGAGLGALTALRRHAWEVEQRDRS